MRFIETKTHGYLDYIMGALLIAAPWIFDFDRGGAETWVPVAVGVAMIGLALLTDYELGASRQVSMRTHLTIDLISGALLAASPWIFGFDEYVWAPHLILGVLEIGAALFTKLHPSNERREHRHTAVAH
jgi:hypothetical protein